MGRIEGQLNTLASRVCSYSTFAHTVIKICVYIYIYTHTTKFISMFSDTNVPTYKVYVEVHKEHKRQKTYRALPAMQSRMSATIGLRNRVSVLMSA